MCFWCGKKGHISGNCPDKGKFQVRALVTELINDEKKEAMEALKKEGFKGLSSDRGEAGSRTDY